MSRYDKMEDLARSRQAWTIIEALDDGRKTPTEIGDEIGSHRKSVMNYLRYLRKFGVVERAERDGRKQYYRARPMRVLQLYRRRAADSMTDVLELFEEVLDVPVKKSKVELDSVEKSGGGQ